MVRTLIIVAAAVALGGCVSQQVYRVNSTPVVQATETLPEETLLDVGVVVFETGIPEDPTEDAPGVFPRVREAEARVMPYQLKNTMQRSGYWGAVRVLPAPSTNSELLVFGQINHSDGDMLDLQIRAEDATGREWLNRRYRERIPAQSYRSPQDAYQNVYNQIVNDLVEARADHDREALARIRQVAEMRFAAELSPEAFDGYVEQNRRGIWEVRRLPAENDPLIRRARQVRQRDHMFVDTLDAYYGGFQREIGDDYNEWRRHSRDEAEAVRELQSSARWRTGLGIAAIVGAVVMDSQTSNRNYGQRVLRDVAVYGGIEAIRSGAGKRREAEVHRTALQEVSGAFNESVRPTLVEIQGTTHRLTGTAEAQYEEWQRLMRELYMAEAGIEDDFSIYADASEGPPEGPIVDQDTRRIPDITPVQAGGGSDGERNGASPDEPTTQSDRDEDTESAAPPRADESLQFIRLQGRG